MKFEKIILSRWFIVSMLVMAFVLPPFASKGFAPSEIGNIVYTTLSNSFVTNILPYSYIPQIIMLLLFISIIVWKNRFGSVFTFSVGVSYLIYAFVQNIAVTDKFGVSFVISNIILMLLTSVVWFADAWKRKTRYTFQNITQKNGWLIPIAVFCFWWPMSFSGVLDFNPLYFFTGHVAQSVQFCPMTPIFLIILILCKPSISLPVYRMTAISGTIIGFWNMMSFFNPTTVYVGIFHLPLFLISLYVLRDSFKLQKEYV